eukprot:TRINITY_DN1476_c0_g1_i1.p1 TRINITY_DN1476_c0_g1~~TRINITY_DN1476_c0_g1_i1.p1  ORF type:complete len:706 (-),score=104.47 TRINITY_DN1476_c0_g1_i1:2234-4351(-)
MQANTLYTYTTINLIINLLNAFLTMHNTYLLCMVLTKQSLFKIKMENQSAMPHNPFAKPSDYANTLYRTPGEKMQQKKKVRFDVYDVSSLSDIKKLRMEKMAELNSFLQLKRQQEESRQISQPVQLRPILKNWPGSPKFGSSGAQCYSSYEGTSKQETVEEIKEDIVSLVEELPKVEDQNAESFSFRGSLTEIFPRDKVKEEVAKLSVIPENKAEEVLNIEIESKENEAPPSENLQKETEQIIEKQDLENNESKSQPPEKHEVESNEITIQPSDKQEEESKHVDSIPPPIQEAIAKSTVQTYEEELKAVLNEVPSQPTIHAEVSQPPATPGEESKPESNELLVSEIPLEPSPNKVELEPTKTMPEGAEELASSYQTPQIIEEPSSSTTNKVPPPPIESINIETSEHKTQPTELAVPKEKVESEVEELDLSGGVVHEETESKIALSEKLNQAVTLMEKTYSKTWMREAFLRLKQHVEYEKEIEEMKARREQILLELELRRKRRIFRRFKDVCKAHHAWVTAAQTALFERELVGYFASLKLHALYKKFKRHKQFVTMKTAFEGFKRYKEDMSAMENKGTVAWYYSSLHKSLYGLKVYMEHRKLKKTLAIKAMKHHANKIIGKSWKQWKEGFENKRKKPRLLIPKMEQRYIGIRIKEKSKILGVEKQGSYKVERRGGIEISKKQSNAFCQQSNMCGQFCWQTHLWSTF